MPPIKAAYLEHQLKRWMRPDAHLFVRPDWRKFVPPDLQTEHPFALYERKYRPDQARVPAGSREGGQWTDEEGGGGNTEAEPAQSSDVEEILQTANKIAARGYSTSYLKCLEICYPLLERRQPPGADFNESAFRKCMRACMGRN